MAADAMASGAKSRRAWHSGGFEANPRASMPALGPKVYSKCSRWAIWSPRVISQGALAFGCQGVDCKVQALVFSRIL